MALSHRSSKANLHPLHPQLLASLVRVLATRATYILYTGFKANLHALHPQLLTSLAFSQVQRPTSNSTTTSSSPRNPTQFLRFLLQEPLATILHIPAPRSNSTIASSALRASSLQSQPLHQGHFPSLLQVLIPRFISPAHITKQLS